MAVLGSALCMQACLPETMHAASMAVTAMQFLLPPHMPEGLSRYIQTRMEEPNMLMELPDPAFAALWAFLPHYDKLRLFELCRDVRDRVLSSCTGLTFTVIQLKNLSPGVSEMLRTLLSRAQPLKMLSLRAPCFEDLSLDTLMGLLQQAASAHAGPTAGPGATAVKWSGAAGLSELELMVGAASCRAVNTPCTVRALALSGMVA